MPTKAKKSKKIRTIRLYSSEGTGVFYNYVKPKDVKTVITLKKYDYRLRKHVIFIEKKKLKLKK